MHKITDDFITNPSQFICWDNICNAGKEYDFPVYKIDEDYRTNNHPYLFVGGSDYPFDANAAAKLSMQDLKLCLANNLVVDHPKLVFFPIGLPHSSSCKVIGNHDQVFAKISEIKKIKNLVYKNFKPQTNMQKRYESYNLKGTHITEGLYDRSVDGRTAYVDNIYNHKFVLCPEGNGIDTLRLWESLYLKSIPIIKSPVIQHFFSDLPILFVQDWNQVLNTTFLEEEYERICAQKWNLAKTRLDFYTNMIVESRKNP